MVDQKIKGLKIVLCCLVLMLSLLACGSEEDEKMQAEVDFKIGHDVISDYTCSMHKQSEDKYLLMMSGIKDGKLVHLNFLVHQFGDNGYHLLDSFTWFIGYEGTWKDFKLKEIDIKENAFQLTIQSDQEIQAKCKQVSVEKAVNPDPELKIYPNALVNNVEVQSLSCSAIQTPKGGVSVSAFLSISDEKKIFLNYAEEDALYYVLKGRLMGSDHRAEGNAMKVHWKLMEEKFLQLSLYYDSSTIQLQCELGKNSIRHKD